MATRKLDDSELDRKDIIDMVRTRVRLEHRIEMRRELNKLEADLLEAFENRRLGGKSHKLTYADVDRMLEAGDDEDA